MFTFKNFTIHQDRCALKVGTDGVVLGAWVNVEGAERILDIGTGTGLLALMAAQRNTAARIDAVEIDDSSAEQAGENVAASPWADRIRVHRMDVRRMVASEPYDLIISNPPFYGGEMISPDARKNLAKHSGELTFVDLVQKVSDLLSDQGRFACIIPMDRKDVFNRTAEETGLFPIRQCSLHTLEGKPAKRLLLELGRQPAEVREEMIIVEHAPGEFTLQYKYLLRDFLLRF